MVKTMVSGSDFPLNQSIDLSVEGKTPSFTRNLLDLSANGNSIVGLAAGWLLQGGAPVR